MARQIMPQSVAIAGSDGQHRPRRAKRDNIPRKCHKVSPVSALLETNVQHSTSPTSNDSVVEAASVETEARQMTTSTALSGIRTRM